MKRRSALLLLATIAGSAVMAQHTLETAAAKHRGVRGLGETASPPSRSVAVWQNDFSNASDWTLGTFGTTENNWVIGTQAPSGTFPIDPIASTTAANGFALYDSDLMCGPDSGYIVNSTPIDLSANPVVLLQFEQFYRAFQGRTYVQVSNNNTDWTTWQVNTLIDVNVATDNPDLVSLPITSVAGGQATVWIRFVYQGNCDYAWMVDDVAIVEQNANDLTIEVAKTTMFDYVDNLTLDSVPYSIYPISELRPLGLNFTFFNAGFEDATNVHANISTTDAYDESADYATIAPSASQRFEAPPYTPSATPGDYTITYSVTADGTDANPADNSTTLNVGVSDDVFARDEGALDGAFRAGTEGDGFIVGTGYHVRQNHTLYGIEAAFPSSSAVGLVVVAVLYDLTTDFTPVAASIEHELSADDLSAAGEGNFIPFVFEEPYNLVAGTDYMVGIQHFGGEEVRVGLSGICPSGTSWYFDETQGQWFSYTSTPMVRMNFNPTVGIAESDFHNGVGLGQNFPNPANGNSTRIDYSLEHGAQVALELRDVNGKLVRTLAQGNMAAGTYNVVVSTADLDAGVYFYTLTTDGVRSTKRMTVVR